MVSTPTVRVPDGLCRCVTSIVVVGSCWGRHYHSEYPDCEGTRQDVSVYHCGCRELLRTALSQRVAHRTRQSLRRLICIHACQQGGAQSYRTSPREGYLNVLTAYLGFRWY